MNIFAVVKKAINSNLDKPLNITLDEIKSDVANLGKLTRKVVTAVGVPYNSTYNASVLSLDDEPVLSIEGVGRILSILPIIKTPSNSLTVGTALITVDDEIVLNSITRFASTGAGYTGKYLVNYNDNVSYDNVIVDAFDTTSKYYVDSVTTLSLGSPTFSNDLTCIVAPNGLLFKQKVDIRLTQNGNENAPNNAGVVVVYELYE